MSDIEFGKAHVGIGMVYRGKLDKPTPDWVAEHDLVSEVYHVISGSATLVLGPDILTGNGVRRRNGLLSSSTDRGITDPTFAMASRTRSRLETLW